MKKWRYLLIIASCISICLVVTIFALLAVDRSNVKRYQEQNYDRFQVNIDSFAEAIANTDGYCDNVQASVFALPVFKAATYEELQAQQLAPEEIVGETQVPYQSGSTAYRLYGRLQGMLFTDMNLTDIALYNRKNDTVIAVTKDGHAGGLFDDAQSLGEALGLHGDLLAAEDKAILPATPTAQTLSYLYVVRHLEDDLMLLCGMADTTWRRAIFQNSAGRSYQL